MSINTLRKAIGTLLLLLINTSVSAWTLTVVDQDGNPAQNAVVQINGADIHSSDTSVAIMDQVNREYSPHVLAIHKNQQVSFPNSDNVRHHIYSFSKAKQFEVKLYAGTPLSPITFENEGIVVLGCNIHDSMLGYIVVYESGKFSVVDKKGMVSFTEPHDTISSISIWHPNLKKPNAINYLDQVLENQVLENKDTSIANTIIAIDINPPTPKKKSSKNKFGSFYK